MKKKGYHKAHFFTPFSSIAIPPIAQNTTRKSSKGQLWFNFKAQKWKVKPHDHFNTFSFSDVPYLFLLYVTVYKTMNSALGSSVVKAVFWKHSFWYKFLLRVLIVLQIKKNIKRHLFYLNMFCKHFRVRHFLWKELYKKYCSALYTLSLFFTEEEIWDSNMQWTNTINPHYACWMRE